MNYSKSIKKTSIGRRILTSWVIIAVLFYFMGFLIGFATFKSDEREEILIYGRSADGIVFQEEMPEWENSGLQFVPLNVPLEHDLQEFTFYLAAGYDIDFTFAMAVMQHESRYLKDVVSSAKDYGLMQINIINHEYLSKQLNISDFLDPYENIRAGMFVLRKLFEKYETPEKVLMAYNMGETGAAKLWEQGIFETNYSKSIMEIQKQFNDELKGDVSND